LSDVALAKSDVRLRLTLASNPTAPHRGALQVHQFPLRLCAPRRSEAESRLRVGLVYLTDAAEAGGVGLQFQKILKDAFAVLRQNRLGVELDSVDGVRDMPQPHDFPLGCFGGDDEAVRQAGPLDEK
jgi:hypothetical protein